ncbi:hypothetical protein [Lactococcus kimchii]|uniref:hypothetical protein n=1 Tax=Lactococcus sp. S-13 TaxID=2507158 RepID=UPI00102321B1|nr:hypothetical protein [Lactococcus sp. S-13]RZI48055.1 hypothetical protein EQJ87_00525 [Lactococcus sp. S-13]
MNDKEKKYWSNQGYSEENLHQIEQIRLQERRWLFIFSLLNFSMILLQKYWMPNWLFVLWILGALSFFVQLFRWDYQKSHLKK